MAGERLLDMLGWKTWTSKNASCCVFQNPLAWISRRALSSTVAERKGNHSSLRGCEGGSMATMWQSSARRDAVMSRNSLWWMVGNHPRCRPWHSLLWRLLHSYSSRGCLQDSIRISGIVSHEIHLCEGKICGHPEGGRSATRRHPLQWQDQQSTAIVGKACRRWQRSLVQTWIL